MQIDLAMVCLAFGVLVATACATPSSAPFSPTTQQAASAKLPPAYSIFETIDPFSAKKHAAAASTPPGVEDTIVLSGTAQSDSGWTAFLQDTASKAVILATIGESVARGKLTGIDLDSVEYSADGKTVHVQVGQNLSGKAIVVVATSQPTGAAGEPSGQSPGQLPNGQPQPGGKHRHSRGGEPTPSAETTPNPPDGEQNH